MNPARSDPKPDLHSMIVLKHLVPRARWLLAASAFIASATTTTLVAYAAEPSPLQDKTLVAWVAPANLTQRGGSALTIAAQANALSPFDGIIFGELSPAKWMAGSDFWRRTEQQQAGWPAETADANTFVQMALVYRGNEIIAYRNGREYSRHRIKEAQAFDAASLVVIGPRVPGNTDFFAGAIDDARIYDRALTAEEIAALKPNTEGAIKPWAWWSFDDAAAKDRTGRFAHTQLTAGARVENGRLILNGNGGTLLATGRAGQIPLQDKTLVAWVAPANLTQRGGSALTIAAQANALASFDGIVFGELAPAKWMAGSDFWRRTEQQQNGWPAETAAANTFVQVALVYRGNEIVAYRNGREYSRHRIKEAQAFDAASLVVIGPRVPGNTDFFAGAIDDARIYDRALTAEEIAALKPNTEGAIKPWAWWSFDDAAAKDRTGRFAHTQLTAGARVGNGRLILDGQAAAFLATRLP